MSRFIIPFTEMARRLKSVPTYCCDGRGRGRVYWRGEYRSLPGSFQSQESWAEFHRVCAVIEATGEYPPKGRKKQITMRELCELYLEYLLEKLGPESKELVCRRYAIRACLKLFADLPVTEFLPPQLKAVRLSVVKAGCVRSTANKRATQLIKLIQWAVEEGYAPPEQWSRLKAVEKIGEGQFGSKDNPKKTPVSEAHLEAVLESVKPETAAALRVLAITGMRTGELLAMRPCEVDKSGRHWIYRTNNHKTVKKTGETFILIPAPAVDILVAWMPKDYTKRWFPHGNSWLRQSVIKACKRAGIPAWHPHQLRHRFATRSAEKLEKHERQMVLRHHDPRMTDHYTAEDPAKLRELGDKLFPAETAG